MRWFRAAFFMMTLYGNQLHASDICLLLDALEEKALLQAQQTNQRAYNARKPASLRLNGIIFRDESSWMIWLNGRPLKSGETIENIRILVVKPESVELIWNPCPGQSHHITLRPNEEFKPTDPETSHFP